MRIGNTASVNPKATLEAAPSPNRIVIAGYSAILGIGNVTTTTGPSTPAADARAPDQDAGGDADAERQPERTEDAAHGEHHVLTERAGGDELAEAVDDVSRRW